MVLQLEPKVVRGLFSVPFQIRNIFSKKLNKSFKVDDMKNPTDYLDPFAVDWCKSIGSNATKVSEILSGPDGNVLNAIQDGIDKANKIAISRAACVQKWTILPVDLSESTGEIGPTFKFPGPLRVKINYIIKNEKLIL